MSAEIFFNMIHKREKVCKKEFFAHLFFPGFQKVDFLGTAPSFDLSFSFCSRTSGRIFLKIKDFYSRVVAGIAAAFARLMFFEASY